MHLINAIKRYIERVIIINQCTASYGYAPSTAESLFIPY